MDRWALAICALCVLLVVALGGCGTQATRERIAQRAGEGDHCFEGCPEGEEAPPKGYADLIVTVSVKVVREDPCLIRTIPGHAAGSSYPVVININGQGEKWAMECREDRQGRIVKGARNPEGGEGVKCGLERRIRMKPGSYKVYLALAEEGIEKQVNLSLGDGTVNRLDFSPVYFRDTFAGRTFTAGVVDFQVSFRKQPAGR